MNNNIYLEELFRKNNIEICEINLPKITIKKNYENKFEEFLDKNNIKILNKSYNFLNIIIIYKIDYNIKKIIDNINVVHKQEEIYVLYTSIFEVTCPLCENALKYSYSFKTEKELLIYKEYLENKFGKDVIIGYTKLYK